MGVRLLGGPEAIANHNTTLGGILMAYYSAGVVGGAIVGSLLPIGRTILGRIVLSLIGAFVFVFCIVTAVDGPFWNWRATDWGFVVFGTIVFGVAGSLAWLKARTG